MKQFTIISTSTSTSTINNLQLKIHRDNKQRELYVVHTSREELDIKERTWIGVRDR